jgi:hypothetical protein
MAQCSYICKDGEPCRSYALRDGSGLCFFHSDPAKLSDDNRRPLAERKRLVLPADFPDPRFRHPADVSRLLSKLAGYVMRRRVGAEGRR